MKISTRRGRIAVALVVGAAIVLGAAAVLVCSAQAQDDNPLKALLDKSGLKYTKLDDESWIVPFDAEGGNTLNVYVTYNDDKKRFALIFSTVVDKDDNFSYGKDLLQEAMKLNNDFAGIKFCLDAEHGDIDCQSEVLMSTLNAEVLSMYINMVAEKADTYSKKLNELVR